MSSDVVSLSLGVSHSAVITNLGELFTAGLGQEGQLGFSCDSYTHLHKVGMFERDHAAV